METHRIRNRRADWQDVLPEQRSFLQRIAAATRGIVTPGNIVTLAGGVLVFTGLRNISRHQHLKGVMQVGAGSWLDVADGWIANKTDTKSPLGEAFDAGMDKITLLAMVGTLVHEAIMPPQTAALMLSQNTANAAATGIATQTGNEIHASEEGKMAIFAQKCSIGLFMLGAVAEERGQQEVAVTLEEAAKALAESATLSLGLTATYGYYRDAWAG